MQIKEFSLISPVIDSGSVLKAIETAIPSDAIEQAIAHSHAGEDRKRAIPNSIGGLSDHCYELVVKGVNENSFEKSSGWFK